MNDEKETVSEIAAQETTRQLIILVFSLAGTALTLILLRELSDPDKIRTWKLRTALYAKRKAQKYADFWQGLADTAATIYNREKE